MTKTTMNHFHVWMKNSVKFTQGLEVYDDPKDIALKNTINSLNAIEFTEFFQRT